MHAIHLILISHHLKSTCCFFWSTVMSDNNLEDDGNIGLEVQDDGLSTIDEGHLNHAGTQ